MDGATLQSKIYKGYGQAAKRIGFPYQQFRAASPSNPTAGAPMQTLQASFATSMRYDRPNKYGTPTWLGMFDGTSVQRGDYLIGHAGTFFVAAMQDTLPILCVECNRTVNVLRAGMGSGVGQVGYVGDTAATETTLMTGWPASVLQGTKGEKSETGLPGDVRTPWWIILLPLWPSVMLRTSDIVTDDLGRRYVLSSAELSDMGWRLTAMQEQM